MTTAQTPNYTAVGIEQTMYKNMEAIFGKKTCSSTGCLKSKNGNTILGKENGQSNFELFKDHRKDYNVMKHNFASPPIMKDEIWAAIRKMKLGKATGPDSISMELLEAVGRRWN